MLYPHQLVHLGDNGGVLSNDIRRFADVCFQVVQFDAPGTRQIFALGQQVLHNRFAVAHS